MNKHARLKLLTLISLLFFFSSFIYAQEKLITVNLKNASLKEVFRAIEKQTTYRFSYRDLVIDDTKNITIEKKNTTVSSILDDVLVGKNLNYSIVSPKSIVISDKPVVVNTDNIRTKKISGVVTDIYGEPIVGASVVEKGTTNGVMTDANGSFSLSITFNSVIQITYIGYTEEVFNASDQDVYNITLRENTSLLDEVIVVGYGTMKKKDLTGSISHIDAEKLAYERPTTVQDLLRSTAPGLIVEPSSSSAKNNAKLTVRGDRSLRADNSPLIVLNGILFNGDLSEINPVDIESIDVLKDASSAAIYGAKSANGVVIITTKKGKSNKPLIQFDGSIAFATMGANRKVYNPEGYLQYRSDYAASSNGFQNQGYYVKPTAENLQKYNLTEEQWRNYDAIGQSSKGSEEVWVERIGLGDLEKKNYFAGNTFDWYDDSWQTGVQQNYNLSLSGQTSNMNYFWSLGYMDNEGNTVGDRFKNYRTSVRLEASATNFLEAGINLFLQSRDEGFIGVDTGGQSANSPFSTPYNEDGSLNPWPMGEQRTVSGVNSRYNNSMKSKSSGTQNVTSSLYAKLKLPYNISYQFTIAPRYSWVQNRDWNSSQSVFDTEKGTASRSTARSIVWTLDNMIKWNYTFAQKHLFDVTLLQSAEKFEYWSESMTGSHFSPSDVLQWHYMEVATDKKISSNDEKYTGDALMARLFYSYDNRYMLTASIRRDGYSAFGRSNPRATFPALAGAWNFSNEKFFNWEPMSNGKVRLSWGKNGNRDIGIYQALSQLYGGTSGKYSYLTQTGNLYEIGSLQIERMSNKGLKWESTASWNAALDFGFLDNRINGSVEWYYMPTTDLLMDRTLPNVSGYDKVVTNLGRVTNDGFEISINSRNIDKENFSWSTTFGLSHNRNRIKHLYYTYEDVIDENGNVIGSKEKDDVGKGWFVGKDISTIWDFEFVGIWQEDEAEQAAKYGQKPGDARARDVNNDYKIGQEDKVFLGQERPKFRWSLRNDFTVFKNWDISFNLYAQTGHKQATTEYLNFFNHEGDYRNTYVRGYWTPENKSNSYARLKSTLVSNAQPKKVIRKDFIRLENISVGYKVPKKITNMLQAQDIRVYGTIRNVAVLTFAKDWDYWDPETGGSIPRIFTLGATITF
ncbi:SusC/RagA family TonB-linked outer membrane protein [Prevotella sp. 10(H)]|uniref:SusC/RagA family TonB-linked outer membrane protein n=1 Tax=Prevotella sp. 10(H) TaxID=1158294 RepID=UPI000691A02E|nr:SusC/RagA family TonB-linked outer membrane protein [Prevotella sp. 10(H)]